MVDRVAETADDRVTECVRNTLLVDARMRERRQAVRIGGAEDAAAEPMDKPAAAVDASVPMRAEPVAPASAAASAARGTSRLQSRIEPTFGRLS